ncbi:MAG: phosphopyruvate hydratase [Verrucomicrobia bacterium]|nr:phosphopyruvate hydratase [Verrucomicrobiota bacterium]
MRIKRVDAWEVLDSRGRPTVAAALMLDDGTAASASVPSGASTGRAEAKERRDGGKRFRGLGCRQAVAHIRGPIAAALLGECFDDQEQLDRHLLELDGTADKSRLGANALLAVSLAFARAAAACSGIELFTYFASLLPEPFPPRLPALTINLFSGGKHAFGQVAIQDVLVVPKLGATVMERLAQVYEVYQQAAALGARRYQVRALTADEGGLAPPFSDSSEMLEAAAEAVGAAGYELGREIGLAVDVAASHFALAGGYYNLDGKSLSSEQLIETISAWTRSYPVISVEDGLAEDDWAHWPVLRRELGDRALTLADDLTCTTPARIRRAIDTGAANALLLKVNQVGTLTEAKESYLSARAAGWPVSVSARSGETEDAWLADLAVGWSAEFIKIGSITQSDRLAKYNRLLQIEHQYTMTGFSPEGVLELIPFRWPSR